MSSTLTARLEQATSAMLAPLAQRNERRPRRAPPKPNRLIKMSPRPLINPDARMIVIFSPKAACSNVAIWFFHHLGQGEKARKHDLWPHYYRSEVYYNSELYRDAVASDLTGYRIVRVIRDPYDRAVSSYRHGLRTRLATRVIAPVMKELDLDKNGLSFDEFLTFLERSDLQSCNPHFRYQRHPIEDVLPVDHLVNISTHNMFAHLAEVASALSLPPASPRMQEWVNEMRIHDRPSAVLPDAPNLAANRFSRRQAAEGPWPKSSSFLTPQSRDRLKKLYAVDIRSYLEGAGA